MLNDLPWMVYVTKNPAAIGSNDILVLHIGMMDYDGFSRHTGYPESNSDYEDIQQPDRIVFAQWSFRLYSVLVQ